MVVNRIFIVVLLLAHPVHAGPPHVPPRNYSEVLTVVLGDEAMVLARATEAALKHLKKRTPKATLSSYYATIERRGPSAWVVTWALNDIDARGGAIEVTLDATGANVTGVTDVE